jgi:hypothetical protein
VGVERGRGAGGRRGALVEPRAQSLDGAREPVRVERLEEVVDRLPVEGVERVLVVGGDEHPQRRVAAVGRGLGRDLQAAASRHPDVEERDVRALAPDRLERRVAVGARGDHLERGPGVGERGRERIAQQRLVVGEDRAHGAHAVASRTGIDGSTSRATVPRGAFSRSAIRAPGP